MSFTYKALTAIPVMVLLVVFCLEPGCRRARGSDVAGRWSVAAGDVSFGPASYWFMEDGNVMANWEDWMISLQAKGTYRLTDATHLEVRLSQGPKWMLGLYSYEIIARTPAELTLRLGQDVTKLKRVADAAANSGSKGGEVR